ncbi:heme-dependent oxidative N-demethylase subunit alpha family protein [Sulfitobacter sp.]|uniref:heme-dependent oxidative N-demethylase subunit alpha family protein n=1 Tax=Sulfitobacter sp. TaxID=1903071 RepID=UPI003001C4B1
MTVIVQNTLPLEMLEEAGLLGMAPVDPHDWLRVDEAYGTQMQRRLTLLAGSREAVLWMDPTALDVACEVLAEALTVLPELGFTVKMQEVICHDGRVVAIDNEEPLLTLGRLVREDICLLRKHGSEQVLVGAVLCFPASWRLAEKAGRPLVGIHEPLEEYDDELARRVQRLFDGVRAGRPLWRFNRLWYDDPELHQPRSAQRRGGSNLTGWPPPISVRSGNASCVCQSVRSSSSRSTRTLWPSKSARQKAGRSGDHSGPTTICG